MCYLYFFCLHCCLINIHIFDYPDSRLSGLFTEVPTSPDNRGSTILSKNYIRKMVFWLRINCPKSLSTSFCTLQTFTQQDTVTHCLLFNIQHIYLYNLSLHSSSLPITSCTYQQQLYLSTNQIAHPGFLIFN